MLWEVTQRILMAIYWRFGTNYLDCLFLKDWTDRLNRNVSKYLRIYAA